MEVKCDPAAAELGHVLDELSLSTDEHTIYWKHAFASAQLKVPTSQAAERILARASCAEFLRCKLDVGWLSDRGIPKKEKERFIQLWHHHNDVVRRSPPVSPKEGRCQAKTYSDSRCKQYAKPNSTVCWQHALL